MSCLILHPGIRVHRRLGEFVWCGFRRATEEGLLGGSWMVISRVVSPLIRVITMLLYVTLLLTPLITV